MRQKDAQLKKDIHILMYAYIGVFTKDINLILVGSILCSIMYIHKMDKT